MYIYVYMYICILYMYVCYIHTCIYTYIYIHYLHSGHAGFVLNRDLQKDQSWVSYSRVRKKTTRGRNVTL